MRIFRLLLVPMIAIALAVTLLLGVRSGTQAPAAVAVQGAAPPPAAQRETPSATAPQPGQPAHPTAIATPGATPTAVPEPLPATTKSPAFVARIAGEAILPADFAAAAAIDGAMSALLGLTPTTSAQLTQQLVNHRLVLHAAAAAGVAPSNPGQRLIELLSAHNKTPADLNALLATQGVTPAAFETYLGQLVLADEFAHAEAARQGVTVEAYIAALRAAADIHYGSAGELEAASAAVAPVETVPVEATPAGTTSAEAAPVEAAPVEAAPVEAAPAPTSVSGQAPVSALSAASQQTPAGAAPEEARGVLVGQLAPQFSLTRLGTGDTETSADLLGTPTVLSFWTTWCPYCLRQTPIMVAAAGRYASADVQFVGIDVAEKPDVVAPYVAEHAIPYPILLDEAGDAAAAFGVSGYPTTFFLDADGRIVAHQIGAMTEQQLTEYIEQLLVTE